MEQPIIAVDHRHLAAESAHGLGEFYSDVATADDKEMFGDLVQFECFDMREWLRLGKSRSRIQNWRACRY